MEKLKKTIIHTVTLIIMSSFSILNIFNLSEPSRPYEKDKNKLLNKYIKKLSKEKKMFLDGSGGMEIDNIEIIGFDFQSRQKMNLNEARGLMIECCEELLEEVNNSLKLRSYLQNFPFKNTNLHFIIGFQPSSGGFMNPPFIAFMSLNKGKINYFMGGFPNDQYECIHRETYEEALKIVQSQNKQNPQVVIPTTPLHSANQEAKNE